MRDKYIVADIEELNYHVGVSYDPKYGYRVHYSPFSLVDALREYNKIVTYNGERYDFRILEDKVGAYDLRDKSVDLYRIIKNHYVEKNDSSQLSLFGDDLYKPRKHHKGELTLKNVAYASFGMPAYEGKDLVEKCRQDVRMTRYLFDYMKKNNYVRHASHSGLNYNNTREKVYLSPGWMNGGIWLVLGVV